MWPRAAVPFWPHERSKESAAAGNHRRTRSITRSGPIKPTPSFPVGAAVLATRRAAAGQMRRAMRVLADAWKRSPAPELIAAARMIAKTKRRSIICGGWRKSLREIRIIPRRIKHFGEAALAARLWGEARRHLLAALQSHPTQGVYRLLAKLEEAEFANHAAAHEWLGKAAHAAPDPGWACTVCGAPAGEWTLTCPSCGAIDSMAWVASHAPPASPDTKTIESRP